VFALTFVFNGYLTARPVVLYGRSYQLDLRLWTIPIEDFIYGFSLVTWNTTLLEWFKRTYPCTEVHRSTHRLQPQTQHALRTAFSPQNKEPIDAT
ncbi:MAG: lycopene cyclase domain-containing protein, partial [Myxococcota bacterium]